MAAGLPAVPALCCLAPRPAAACRAALFLYVLSPPRPSCPCRMLHAALLFWPTGMALSQLQGWPGRLPVCERSVGPRLHGS